MSSSTPKSFSRSCWFPASTSLSLLLMELFLFSKSWLMINLTSSIFSSTLLKVFSFCTFLSVSFLYDSCRNTSADSKFSSLELRDPCSPSICLIFASCCASFIKIAFVCSIMTHIFSSIFFESFSTASLKSDVFDSCNCRDFSVDENLFSKSFCKKLIWDE